ncbi:hypothetical protein L7F22_063626 [Adiantum nelumboides]|nr:hypothetical protein [Adiantum nelumboides]
MIEKYLPPSMLTIQVHLLLHVVDEIEMAGTVHCRWMFFLERFMKTLKGFVRQKARPEGSMAEGWIVQESLVYITEWIVEFDKETQESPMLWRLGEDERLTTDVAHGGGTSKRMDTTLEENINCFCMLHHPTMDKWLTTYETAKEERYDARRAFRARQRGRMVRYPPELEVLPRFMPLLWLHQQLTKAEEEGVHVSLEEWEFSRGCFDKVIFYPKPSDERLWYVIEVAQRGVRIYENYNLITVADAEPIETEVAELPDIDMTMPEDDVEPIEIELAEMPEDDIVDLNDIDFSLGGELTVDLEVGIELCQDAVKNT